MLYTFEYMKTISSLHYPTLLPAVGSFSLHLLVHFVYLIEHKRKTNTNKLVGDGDFASSFSFFTDTTDKKLVKNIE